MKVTFLDGYSLATKLPSLLSSCTKLDIAMAYIKIGGLRTFLRAADTLLKRGMPIRIVFGLSSRQGITDKESAEVLMELSKQSNVLVKKWSNCGFHPKLFIFDGDHPRILVGSANLLQLLLNSVETSGPWMQLYEYVLKDLFILNRRNLSKRQIKSLLTTFRHLSTMTFPSLDQQPSTNFRPRIILDEAILRCLCLERKRAKKIGEQLRAALRCEFQTLSSIDAGNRKNQRLSLLGGLDVDR